MSDIEITIAQLLQGVWLAETPLDASVANIKVSGVSLDNRTLSAGSVFIAVPGDKVDGRAFIEKCDSATAAVLAEADTFGVDLAGAVPVVHIPQLKQKISRVAANFYGHPSRSLTIIGITGTNGKTTCAYLLAQLLSKLQFSCGMVGTLGFAKFDENGAPVNLTDTGLTTPSALDCQKILAELQQQVGAVAMEVSSHGLAQGRVADVDFNGAIFTNLSRDHLDYHASLEEYAATKAELFEREELSFVVINADDAVGVNILTNGVAPQAIAYSYSLGGEQALVAQSENTVVAHSIEWGSSQTVAQLHTPWGAAELATVLVGRYNLSNVLAVLTTACALGYPLVDVVAQVKTLQAAPGRLQRVNSSEQPLAVFVDYAHTPDALEKVLSEVAAYTQGKLWVVIGCGGNRDVGKRPLMAEVAERLANCVVLTSDNPRDENPELILKDMLAGLKNKDAAMVIADRKNAIEYAVANAAENDAIVIAGKGHENYQLVKGEKLPFDDALIAKEFLAAKCFSHARGQA
ncbi:UDP-N-acetylmuramoyl-L-alanyl-D-glutamate--2,6-diaminopimelate ligase [Saccharophagus degradans]|uniref:UDP-N-acetylmuramoyl-L-alanyl-D-glutamate--2, 6-diaminopimelate ligase n=1 Tax=Saccharophagus degradans TaxID=86304 RepID=UPI0024782782|nr:UDP-N-acetylmuramoyl-L-alanyl-D-glutamate--2,6-diaminopimelate ligase [Saccharophagus degradans]WGO97713.1 UDP-N-acetylmuramoyl-L-alanyl-D-glutamate--2,6-diaminopimelate ligase [Saccharophagus degradans]